MNMKFSSFSSHCLLILRPYLRNVATRTDRAGGATREDPKMTINAIPPASHLLHNDDIAQTLRGAKAAYSTRYVARALEQAPELFSIDPDLTAQPRSGDVVIARVAAIGQHKRLESPESRRQILYVGDEVMVAYGSRYAADQFEAFVPEDLGPTNLVAAGGMAASVASKHASISNATSLEPIGLLTRNGQRVNLTDWAPHQILSDVGTLPCTTDPKVMMVFGSSMNSGKSAAVASLVKGLANAGLQVAAGKATGTGSGNDPNSFVDAGAHTVLDFTDFGHASTFQLPYEEIKSILLSMRAALADTNPDVIVLEVADGLFQPETARLINDDDVQASVDRVVYAAVDALGASAGAETLLKSGLDLAAVTGVLTSSPLATREATAVLPVTVVNTFDMCQPEVATQLINTDR